MHLPDWIAGSRPAALGLPSAGRARNPGFARRTVLGVARFLGSQDHSYGRRQAPRCGTDVDARAKVVAALLMLIAVSATHSLLALIGVILTTTLLVAIDGVQVWTFLMIVWSLSPLFTALVALPALFAAVTPGPTLLGRGVFTISRTGAAVAGTLVLRTGASVTIALALASTTGLPRLLEGLRRIGIPGGLTQIAGMTYRYAFLLAREVERMHLGLLSRSLEPIDDATARGFVGSRIAVLLGKAGRTAQEVHLAMLARGYTGEYRTMDARRIRVTDVAFGVAAAVVALLVIRAPAT